MIQMLAMMDQKLRAEMNPTRIFDVLLKSSLFWHNRNGMVSLISYSFISDSRYIVHFSYFQPRYVRQGMGRILSHSGNDKEWNKAGSDY